MDDSTPSLSFLPDFPGREILYHPLDANKAEIRVITVQPSNDRSSATMLSANDFDTKQQKHKALQRTIILLGFDIDHGDNHCTRRKPSRSA
jgi:hypothetical protein